MAGLHRAVIEALHYAVDEPAASDLSRPQRHAMPMNTILFLDIDGVLNGIEHIRQVGGAGCPPPLGRASALDLKWCPQMVGRLRRIVEETGCDIVISSSWRRYGEHAVAQWQRMFGCYGWPDAPVIGETPTLDEGDRMHPLRGREVERWLSSAPHIERYVCLDDSEEFFPHQPVVQTSGEHGLTDLEAMRCIEVLGQARR
jgi:hypothetical protein